jgi:hypothetical protein
MRTPVTGKPPSRFPVVNDARHDDPIAHEISLLTMALHEIADAPHAIADAMRERAHTTKEDK